jgi:hypothetical protein
MPTKNTKLYTALIVFWRAIGAVVLMSCLFIALLCLTR